MEVSKLSASIVLGLATAAGYGGRHFQETNANNTRPQPATIIFLPEGDKTSFQEPRFSDRFSTKPRFHFFLREAQPPPVPDFFDFDDGKIEIQRPLEGPIALDENTIF